MMVGEEQVKPGLELGIVTVSESRSAPASVTDEHGRPPLYHRRPFERPSLTKNEREAFERRRLDHRERAGDARIADGLLYKPRLNDVCVRRQLVNLLADHDQCQWTGMTSFVPHKVAVQLGRSLCRVDSPYRYDIRSIVESEPPAERYLINASVDIDPDSNDGARTVGGETTEYEIALLAGREGKGVRELEDAIEMWVMQRRFVVSGRLQDRRHTHRREPGPGGEVEVGEEERAVESRRVFLHPCGELDNVRPLLPLPLSQNRIHHLTAPLQHPGRQRIEAVMVPRPVGRQAGHRHPALLIRSWHVSVRPVDVAERAGCQNFHAMTAPHQALCDLSSVDLSAPVYLLSVTLNNDEQPHPATGCRAAMKSCDSRTGTDSFARSRPRSARFTL